MIRGISLLYVLLLLLAARPVTAQDYSNKGKEFWLCFPAHVPTDVSTQAKMSIFISGDQASSGTITVNGYTVSFAIAANQVSEGIDIPYSVAYISRQESGAPVSKGIHVQVDEGRPPVVVFAHIYADARSEAMLVLPVNVLGQRYYSMNYYQSTKTDAYSQFAVVATEEATTVRYRLRKDGLLNATATTVLLPHAGDVLQIQDLKDLSGSIIESVSPSGTEGCKRIAVFSGSSANAITGYGCSAYNNYSYDPLVQQCYPVNSWGKEYAFIPFAENEGGYHPRIMACEDNTEVDFGGVSVVLNAGEYFPVTMEGAYPLTMPLAIKANKPVAAAAYMMMCVCAGNYNTMQGDADMVLLNPVEQNIKDISLFSSNLEDIRTKYVNVYMPTVATGSFRINGQRPAGKFAPVVPANGYSWLTESLPLSTTAYRLTADTGFNAVAYGLGKTESYAYSAGTYVKDRYQFLQVANKEGIVDKLATCKGMPFDVYMTFPYQPLQITWRLPGMQADVISNNPVAESTSSKDGKKLYRYKMPEQATMPATGVYTAGIIAISPTIDGCGGTQELTYDITVIEPPVAAFTHTVDICNTQKIQFTYTGTEGDTRDTAWRWRFGDGGAVSARNPLYQFPVPGPHTVSLYAVNDIGCHSTPAEQQLVIDSALQARFTYVPDCVQQPVVFTSNGIVPQGYNVTKQVWNFGDGVTVSAGDDAAQTHTYNKAGTYKVALTVHTANGCTSSFDTTVVAEGRPVLSFTPALVYIPDGSALFTAGSNVPVHGYVWDFGDGNNASGLAAVKHTYAAEGSYGVKLSAVTANGCAGEVTQQVKVVPAPVAPVVPNIFSPNGDGIHDYWDILYLERYAQVKVQVFNRWGVRVFNSNGYSQPWNGKQSGKPLPAGTYYYIIETGGATAKITGTVTIIQ